MRSRSKLFRVFTLIVAMNMLISTMVPTVSFALSSGPAQPEFSSFEPVATTNMVNDFTGDFTYNLPILQVPGPHGSGYPITLSYHSGVTPEEEASWVGYGWTLNAGAINRMARGIPDDFKDKPIETYNEAPANWTATVGANVSGELFGSDKYTRDILSLGGTVSYRYNNYRGFGENKGVGVGLGSGVLDIGYNVDNGEGSFSLNLNPGRIFSSFKKQAKGEQKILSDDAKKEQYKQNIKDQFAFNNMAVNAATQLSSSVYGLYQFKESVKSTQLQPYYGVSANFTVGLEKNPSFLPAGVTTNIFGSYTWQKNKNPDPARAYGYMYTGEGSDPALSTGNSLLDYHIENGSSYSKRDAVLGVPFNNSDQFMVTGEGIGGGFRLHHSNVGHFGPQEVTSEVAILNIGGEFSAGSNFGGGADIGTGLKTTKLRDWNKHPNGDTFSSLSDGNTRDEPVFFRFNNDLGGSWGEAIDDNPFQARIERGQASYTLQEGSAFQYQLNNGQRSGRSSYIGYNLNKEAVQGLTNQPTYKAYSKRLDINILANKGNDLALADNIGELAVFNQNGLRYVYGLPVYSRKEKTLSVSPSGGNLENRHSVYVDESKAGSFIDNSKTKMGRYQADAYASSFLLTEITTPEYVDRSLDGPTRDDFGGYTRFDYKKIYGGGENASWYRWRMPFHGLRYQQGGISDPKDDLASVSSGEKEIYYLESIETKSHVAIFTMEDRDGDGLGALDENYALIKQVPEGSQPKPTDRLKKLTRIDLYSINELLVDGELQRDGDGEIEIPAGINSLKTVHFEYKDVANELAAGGPNMANGRGKLTLSRVYYEYNGKSTTRISPYQFEYEYPKIDPQPEAGHVPYPAKYRSGGVEDVHIFKDESGSPATGLEENPNYSPFSSDAWGNYQPSGEEQNANGRPWINQEKIPNVHYDPAAWQLKVIKLPSGGEIHVQYEADDYQYVQDKEAHVMASLAVGSDDSNFIIDMSSIGINSPTEAEVDRLHQMIYDRYVTNGNKIYFKFLYELISDNDGSTIPSLASCNAEYITGYVDVVDVIKEETTAGSGVYLLKVVVDSGELPEQICKEFTRSNRIGLIDRGGNCGSDGVLGQNDKNPGKVVRQLLGIVPALANGLRSNSLCSQINHELSYLRIPTIKPKIGGGLRVKRLLTFDKGLEGNPVLYGNEYNYETLDDFGNLISSGVATNEPQSMREENILVDDLKRQKQKFISKIIAGEDKKEQEGPIGESVYPGASVGYSRVAKRNIHMGETNPGFTVNEYFTAKSYPVKASYTDIDDDEDLDFLYGGFANYIKRKQWASQGFSIVLNNMHGQVSSVTNYTGDYTDWVDLEKSTSVSRVEYEYYEPGETIPVQTDAFGGTTDMVVGRDVDITLAQKALLESFIDANVEVDFSVGILKTPFPIPIPFLTSVPTVTQTEGVIATHATTKVVSYPAIVKRTTNYQDGIYHVSEPLAFDKLTGNPIAKKTFDEFERTHVGQEIRASMEYKAMRDKAYNEGKLILAGFVLDGNRLKVATGQACDLNQFTRGDLIELGDGTQALFHVVDIDHVRDALIVEVSQQNIATDITSGSEVRIIRSGRTNRLNDNIGLFARHDPTPIDGSLLAIVNEGNRYVDNHPFVNALNTAVNGLTVSEGTFTLNGTYADMDMSGYVRDVGVDFDWSQVSIRNVEFRYYQMSDHLQLDLMAFEVTCGTCGGTWYSVAAEGWGD